MSTLRSAMVIVTVVLGAATMAVRVAALKRATLIGTAMMLDDVPKSCPVTRRPTRPFVPPTPYPVKINSDGFWFGDQKLWTLLPEDGRWRLPHYAPTDSGFGQKLFWWRQGYDWRTENPPKLTVTGRRLDSPAPPLKADHPSVGWKDDPDHAFMVVGLYLPTLGCWDITGHYKDQELSFVIWVAQ